TRRDAGRDRPHRPERPPRSLPVRPSSASNGEGPPEGAVATDPKCREKRECPDGLSLPLRSPQPGCAVHLPRQARVPEGREVPHQSESAAARGRVRPGAEEVSEGNPSRRWNSDRFRWNGTSVFAGKPVEQLEANRDRLHGFDMSPKGISGTGPSEGGDGEGAPLPE